MSLRKCCFWANGSTMTKTQTSGAAKNFSFLEKAVETGIFLVRMEKTGKGKCR